MSKLNRPPRPCPPEVRKWLSEHRRGGFCDFSTEKRREIGKITAARSWKKRRAKYGWQGYDIKKRRKTAKQLRDILIAQNPDLAGHPVWKES